ncbi:MAG TPA: DUF2279 domain-containing protein [Azospirillum sp.]|nr:DUF2279 domain-containing protein [Azospirillum sp.]
MRLLVLFLLIFAVFGTSPGVRAEPLPGSWKAGEWSREDKALTLNLGAATLALGWGAWSWDWGTAGPRFQDEGWFGRETGEGGADKLGHAWSAYALSHLFANRYEAWGYGRREAARYGALSGVGLMGLVEVGDAFSDDYGFSYQDMLFNAVGAALGYVLWEYPEIHRKIDFRVEYNPFRRGDYQADVFTDYNRLKYLIAVKADGFDAVRDPLLKHLEFHVGFYARNYADHGGPGSADLREQHLYVGIGLNLTRLLAPHLNTGGVLHYLQPPYTYVPASRRVDR